MIGTCKLCLKDGAELRQSHFLPQGLYKALRGNPANGNPNPWVIDTQSGVQTSFQLKAYLLCDDCEQRLAKHGEDWIFRVGLRNGGRFRLLEHLTARTPDLKDNKDDVHLHYAASIPFVDVDALSYFAASMFWRGAIHPWNSDGTYPLRLGKYEESFRRYLLGETGFPEQSSLVVSVRRRGENEQLSYAPVGKRASLAHVHKFVMPGFVFVLWVGKVLPVWSVSTCFVRGSGNQLFVGAFPEDQLVEEISHTFVSHLRRESAKP